MQTHEEKAAASNLGWELIARTVVERTAPILPELTEWENDYCRLQESQEYYRNFDWPDGLGPKLPKDIDMNSPSENTFAIAHDIPHL